MILNINLICLLFDSLIICNKNAHHNFSDPKVSPSKLKVIQVTMIQNQETEQIRTYEKLHRRRVNIFVW